jgi:hypothetical protein
MTRDSRPAKASHNRARRFDAAALFKRCKTHVAKPLSDRAFRRVLYLIELDQRVASEPSFRAANPNYIPGMPCFYVGSTSLTPQERFEQHTSGRKNASRIAFLFGRKLRMDLVSSSGTTLPRAWALKAEARLARELRAKHCGAWQA